MSRLRWAKFFWEDWASDNALSLCSLAAQGLWMRLLCIASQGSDYGSLTINGTPASGDDLAKLIKPHIDPRRFARLLAELERKKVVSRDDSGTLFSRRMRVELESFASQSAKGKKSAQSNGANNLGRSRSQPDRASGSDQMQKHTQTPPQPPRGRRAGGSHQTKPTTRNGFAGSVLDDIEQQSAPVIPIRRGIGT